MMRLGMGIRLGPVGGGGVAPVAFTPASLAPAAWHDISDITSMYQDSAGTTSAVIDGPVGRVNDKSGNGYHLLQATTAAKPILRSAGGLWWLEFDGVDDYMDSADFAVVLAQPDTIAVAASFNSIASAQQILDGTSARQALLIEGGSNPLATFAGSVVARSTFAPTAGAAFVANALFSGASSVLRVNGAAQAASNPGASGLNRIRLGAFAPGAAHLGGRVFGIVAVSGVLSAPQNANLETWLGAKVGMTL